MEIRIELVKEINLFPTHGIVIAHPDESGLAPLQGCRPDHPRDKGKAKEANQTAEKDVFHLFNQF